MDVTYTAILSSCLAGALTVIGVVAHHAAHHRISAANGGTPFHRHLMTELAWSSAPMVIVISIAMTALLNA